MSGVAATNRGLSGKYLRWVVCVHLAGTRRTMTVAEIVEALEADGHVIAGRAGKTVSDALRWEVARGRVVQNGRGRYGPGKINRSTLYSMRERAAAARPTGIKAVAPSDDPLHGMEIDFDALVVEPDEWSGPAPAVVVD